MANETCPNCGMAKEDWKGNMGEGVRAANNQFFCCQGCLDGSGCTCKEAAAAR